jgi:hypothetical protein
MAYTHAATFAMALAVVGAIVVISMILFWRRKEQELAAAAELDIPGPLACGTVGILLHSPSLP